MNFVIRKADVDDFEEILSLIIEFSEFQKTPEKVSITLDQLKKDKEFFQCLIAVNEKEIIGFASYHLPIFHGVAKGCILMIFMLNNFTENILPAKTVGCRS